MSGMRVALVLVGASAAAEMSLAEEYWIRGPGHTADIYIGPPPLDLSPRDVPRFDLPAEVRRERPRRDWEQRQRKRRRR